MACYACAWYAQLCGGWNPVRLLLLVQLAFVLLGSSLTIAESDSVYYDYDVLSSNQRLTEDQVTHVFHTNDLNGAILSRRRRNADEKPSLQLENAAKSTETNDNGVTDNVTKIRFGMHQYYNSTIFSDEKIAETYRVDMNKNSNLRVTDPFDRRDEIKTTVHLKFEFPFYGLKIDTIQIATDGYLFTGEENLGSRFKLMQYIAPLTAVFATSLSTSSRITYSDNGTALTVEWKDMVLQDKPEAGNFTFQVTLHENGDIVFVYCNIPLSLRVLDNTSGLVRIGVSDAYKMQRNFMSAPRITIFEYHRINFNIEDISNGSAIYLKALPTCISMNNCNDCMTKVPNFNCKWCPALQKCNAGKSRIWQNWVDNGCEKSSINGDNSCQASQDNPSKSDSPKQNSKYESNANRLRRAIAENSKSDESGAQTIKSDGKAKLLYEDIYERDNATKAVRYLEYYNSTISEDKKIADTSTSNDSNESTLSRKRRYLSKESVPSVAYDATSEPPENKTDAASVNVTYSTDKVTTVASAMNPADKLPHLPDANSTAKIDAPKSSKNTTIVVSNPMNPVTGQPDEKNDDLIYAVPQVHVWANQTRWENATRKPETRITEKPDPPKPDAPTLSTEEKTNANGTPGAKVNNATSTDKIVVSTTNATDSDLGDISISKFSDVTNNTLAQNNITKTEEDTHQYYNSTFFSDENIAKSYWVDMDNHPDRQVNDLLSQSHRRAATVKLKFDFPFYGHKVRNITIATGGFLYTGEYVHSWLAATQYIAPLMANFDTRLSKSSWVKYADNGTAFTVEWEEVVLQDRPEAGGFTFQATLHDNGNIVFVYSKIPLTVEAIEDTAHPVKVGLSDAYIMDRTIFFVRRKTIYEYHRVNFNHQEIQNWTVIYLKALPTCLELDNCNDCLTKVPEFECKWCPELQQCSTGTFRFRQDWLEKGCEQKNIKEPNSCPATQTSYTENLDSHDHPGHTRSDAGLSASVDQNTIRAKGAASPSILEHSTSNMNMGVSGIIGILVVVTLIAGLVAWAGYAYRNPHSASGQMLIRYRPSQWSWRRGEARYTAATIHM